MSMYLFNFCSFLYVGCSLHAEQQEQLKVICNKFKEQVNQHLQDCRSTFEGLEVYQTEFKGAVEKQSMTSSLLLDSVLFCWVNSY